MAIAKFILFVSGLVWVVYGGWLFFDPTGLSYAGFEFNHWSVIVEVQAMYGAVEFMLGIFAWLGLWNRKKYMHSALVVWAFIYGGLAFGRLVGIYQWDGDYWMYTFGPEGLPEAYNAGALWVLEFPSFLLCLLALWKTKDHPELN